MKPEYTHGNGKAFKDDGGGPEHGKFSVKSFRQGERRSSSRGRDGAVGAAASPEPHGAMHKAARPQLSGMRNTAHGYAPGSMQPLQAPRGRAQSPILDKICDGIDAAVYRSSSHYALGDNMGVRQTRSAPDSQAHNRSFLPADAWGRLEPLRTGVPKIPGSLNSSFVSLPATPDARSSSIMSFRPQDVGLLNPGSPSSTPGGLRPRSAHHPLAKLQGSHVLQRLPHAPQGESPQLSPIGSPNGARRRINFPVANSYGSVVNDSLLDDTRLIGRIPSAPAMTPLPLHQLPPEYVAAASDHSFRPGSARNRLVDAIRSKDVGQLMGAIEKLKDRDGRVRGINDLHPITNWSPLHEAMIVNDLSIVSVLLGVGADPNIGHPTRGPPLLHAAAFGERDMVELLLKAGADVNATDVAMYTAMHYACAGGHVETARTLVMFNANVQLRNIDGEVPLDIARPEVVKALFGPSTPSSVSPGQHRSTFPNSPISPIDHNNRPPSSNSSRFTTPEGGPSPAHRTTDRRPERVSGFIPEPESPPELHLPPTVFGGSATRLIATRTQPRPPVGLQDIIESFQNEDQDLIKHAVASIHPDVINYYTAAQRPKPSPSTPFQLSTPSQHDSITSRAPRIPHSSVLDSGMNPLCLDDDDFDDQHHRLTPCRDDDNQGAPHTASSEMPGHRPSNLTKLKTGDSFPPLMQDHSPTQTPQSSPRSPRAPYVNPPDARPGFINQAEKALSNLVGYPSTVAKVHAHKIFSTSIEVTTGPIQWTQGELLGEGGYGKVYAGLNQATGELMAVKVIEISGHKNVQRQQQQLLELQQELEMYKTLKHKHVVGYIDAQFDPAALKLYIFLEFVPGGSIASMLERFGPFKEELVRNYTRQLLTGLEYLHASRIVHRDLKGGNVLVSRDGTVKLADFGASKAYRDATLNEAMKSLKGSAFWMAPEVIHKTGHGRPADIWSLGCTVIEMLTGMHPWPQFDNQMTAMFNIAKTREGPPRPEGISEVAKGFLDKCLCFDPSRRWSASELLQHPFVSGLEVLRREKSVN